MVNIESTHTLGDDLLPIMDLSIRDFEISCLVVICLVPKVVFEFSAALILVSDEVDFELVRLESHLLLRNFLDLVLLESKVVQVSVVATTATREPMRVFSHFPVAHPFQ